jgi:hypothetical protein
MKETTPSKLTPFSADLHIHSALSPCAEDAMTPPAIIKKLSAFGVDVFSITDHNSCFNSASFEAAARTSNLLFVPGIELQTMEEIHLLAYFPALDTLESFCTNIVRPNLMAMKNIASQFGSQLRLNADGKNLGEVDDMLSMPLNLSLDALVDDVHSYNGIAVAAHVDRGFSVISQLGFIPPNLNLDAVGVWNADKIETIKKEQMKDLQLNVISSSDTHHLNMFKPPKMKLWLPEEATVKSILECIANRGPGRITIKKTEARKRPQGKDKAGINKQSDWKSLYK